MERWAEFVLRNRRWVMLFWLAIFVAGVMASGQTSKRLTVDFSLPNQPGTQTALQIRQLYGNGGENSPYLVSVTLPSGVAGHEAEIGHAFAAIGTAWPGVRIVDEANTGDKAFRTSDGQTAYAMVFYPFDRTNTSGAVPTPRIKSALEAAKPAGSTIGVTGEDALATGNSSNSGPGVAGEVLLGALGGLFVLIFVFASFLALLPLVVAAVSILATFLMLLPITYLTDVSFIVQFLIALIGLGVAIDYSLLLVTRWREERDHGRDNHEAVVIAMSTAGRAVVFSGVTVAIGLLALIVLPAPFMRSMGYGGALIPLSSVLVTLSLTPAILASVGPKVDWPKIRHENRASAGWSRWARLVVKQRWVAAVLALSVLFVLIGVFTGVRIGAASSESLASNGPAVDAVHVLEKGGVPTGAMTPIEVLTTSGQAASVATALRKVEGVNFTVAPTGPDNVRAGKAIVIVVPERETVNSKSVGVVRRVISATKTTPGVLGVTGLGTAQIDFLHAIYGNFPLMLSIISLLTYVLLVRAFRSLLLPFKAVLLNLVSLGATFGVMVLFWQDGHGSKAIFDIQATGAVTFWVPLMVFAFLFGLSMDYEVFILSRIREEYDAARSTDAAVIEGIGRTGRLVTSAALILFLAFVALASGPGTDLKVMASGLAFGILLDATIVRSVLVPSLVSLFGKWNWYLPDSIAKILRVEPSHPHPEPKRGTKPPSESEPQPVG